MLEGDRNRRGLERLPMRNGSHVICSNEDDDFINNKISVILLPLMRQKWVEELGKHFTK